MAVAKVTEIISTPPKSFDDAVANGITRAADTCDNCVQPTSQPPSVWEQIGHLGVSTDRSVDHH